MSLTNGSTKISLFEGRSEKYQELKLKGSKEKCKETTKILIVISIPILILICVTALSFAGALATYNESLESLELIERNIQITRLVSRLQVERGLTALYLSSNKTNSKAFKELSFARGNTDDELENLNVWPDLELKELVLSSKLQFLDHLNQYRISTVIDHISFYANIEFYTAITVAFLDVVSTAITLPREEKLLVSYDALLRASDASGVQRALGSTFYSQCKFSPDDMDWFNQIQTAANTYLEQVFKYEPATEEIYESNQALLIVVDHLSKQLKNAGYMSLCRNLSQTERFDESLFWFDNMTLYISHLGDMRTYFIERIEIRLSETEDDSRNQLTMYAILLVAVSLTSAVTSFLINGMTKRLSSYALEIGIKTEELQEEKSRTDKLLYQMMPRSVADHLRSSGRVDPDFFESVSVFFSNIVDFTAMTGTLSPRNIINLLNTLYNMFDAILESHDVYKVETIGDSYMVVSGLPERNGDKHASEIASMSLKLIDAVANFKSTTNGTLKQKKIRIRIGMHSVMAWIVLLQFIIFILMFVLKHLVEYYMQLFKVRVQQVWLDQRCLAIVFLEIQLIPPPECVPLEQRFSIRESSGFPHSQGEPVMYKNVLDRYPSWLPMYCLHVAVFHEFNDFIVIAAMKIQSTEASKTIIEKQKDYRCEERGLVEIKGKGQMTTYWVYPAKGPYITTNLQDSDE